MSEQADNVTVAVRLNTPRTATRLAMGSFMLLLALVGVGAALWLAFGTLSFERRSAGFKAMILGLLVAGAAVALWEAGLYLRGKQIVTVENGRLVIRTRSRIGPPRVHRVSLDKIRGRTFAVREYARDAADGTYRPSFSPRVVILGDHGTTLVAAGVALSLSEAGEAREALNRLIGGDDNSPTGPGRMEESELDAVRNKPYREGGLS